MGWSLAKENATRTLVSEGLRYVTALMALSDVTDDEVPATVERLREDYLRGRDVQP